MACIKDAPLFKVLEAHGSELIAQHFQSDAASVAMRRSIQGMVRHSPAFRKTLNPTMAPLLHTCAWSCIMCPNLWDHAWSNCYVSSNMLSLPAPMAVGCCSLARAP